MQLIRSLAFLAASLSGAVGAQEPVPSAPVRVASSAPASLTRADVEAWLDGYVPNTLARDDLASAVVVVVKDDAVLVAKGYGYADVEKRTPVDPAKTLFRPGSISKLYTWTAVMQLVEQGKLDLDKDINGYIDFSIPPFDGKPITLRQLMSHSAGFEDVGKHLFASSVERLMPLGDYLKQVLPPRRFAPGTVSAYSNYGTALAGYIVERASGEAWNDYVEKNIFAPLRMQHATFRQPLPEALAPDMAGAYGKASEPVKPYELVIPAPAGSMSVAGLDMARFMLAHLHDGRYGDAQILKPETAQQMHAAGFRPIAGLDAMSLGFIGGTRNGQQVIGHGGATEYFQSDLRLIPAAKVGYFISVGGPGDKATALNRAFYGAFMNRYFPVEITQPPATSTARAHGQQVAGHYENSRAGFTSFFALVNLLSQATVSVNADDTLSVSAIRDAAGNPKRWREVGDYRWQEVGGNALVAASMQDGKVFALWTTDSSPVAMLMPAPASRSAAWNTPLLLATVAVPVLTIVLWPIAALVRKRYAAPLVLTPDVRRWRRLTLFAVLLNVVLIGVWISIVASLDAGIAALDGGIDGRLRVTQLLGLLAIPGALAALAHAGTSWRGGGLRRWTSLVIAVACVALVWFVFAFNTFNWGLHY